MSRPGEQMLWQSLRPISQCRVVHVQRRRALSISSLLHSPEYLGGGAFSPVTAFAHTLEGLHQWTDLSWPGSIIVFTVGMRLLLFPAHVKQTASTITASNLKEEVSNFQTRIQTLRASNKFDEARSELQQMYAFLKKNNCHPARTIMLSLVPIPFFMSTFFALRNMASQPIQSFLEGGWAWFSNLAVPDPFYILPVVSTISLLASFEVNAHMTSANGLLFRCLAD